MQTATIAHSTAEQRLANCPPEILATVNRRRREIGLPTVEIRRPAAPPKDVLRVFIVAAPGRCPNPRERDRPEQIDHRAWNLPALNGPAALWTLRLDHGGPEIDRPLFGRLRAEIVPRAGLVVEWTPDLRRADHREAVAAIDWRSQERSWGRFSCRFDLSA